MIEFLIRLITPLEGVDYAIAPIVLAGLTQLPGMLSGMSAARAAEAQGRRDEARSRADKLQAQKALSALRQGKLEFEPIKDKLNERYTDAYEMSMSRAPEQAAREAREQALASALSTGGDPRAMMANMQGAAAFAQGSRADALAGLQGRKTATSTLAGLEQGIADSNRARFRAQFDKELGQAQQLFTASRAQERAAQDAQVEARRQRNQAMLGAAVGTVGGALQMEGVNKFGDIFKSIPGALSTVGTPTQNLQGTSILDIVQGTPFEYGTSGSNARSSSDVIDGQGNLIGIEEMDLLEEDDFPINQKGGKVGKTGGEFNHSTNKKALIDEESGEKEAELTGDETMFVFNPKQTSTFEKLVKGNDSEGLMKFMKKLLKKPQFNK